MKWLRAVPQIGFQCRKTLRNASSLPLSLLRRILTRLWVPAHSTQNLQKNRYCLGPFVLALLPVKFKRRTWRALHDFQLLRLRTRSLCGIARTWSCRSRSAMRATFSSERLFLSCRCGGHFYGRAALGRGRERSRVPSCQGLKNSMRPGILERSLGSLRGTACAVLPC